MHFIFFFFSVGFSSEAMRSEAIRQDPTRKGSVVNVNPTNTRPQSDTPEIRKYKKRFNSEILCAALWGNANLVLPLPFLKCRHASGSFQPLIMFLQNCSCFSAFIQCLFTSFMLKDLLIIVFFTVCCFCFDIISHWYIYASDGTV